MENRFFNRELSWIEFNNRVLNQALRKDLPLIERLQFLAIVSSNFDEFFQVLAKADEVIDAWEKIKAEEYYQAALKYPVMAGMNLFNPFSGYWSNILEKEARKASKSKTGKIDS